MNTRSFLKALATIAVAPQILIPKTPDAYHWTGAMYTRVNPAWESAQYEIAFIRSKELWVHIRDPNGVLTKQTVRYIIKNRVFERVEKTIIGPA